MYPLKKDTLAVINKGTIRIFNWSNCVSKRVNIVAPKIAGIANIKENFAASLLDIPNNRAKEIVIPERDIPGMIAKA